MRPCVIITAIHESSKTALNKSCLAPSNTLEYVPDCRDAIEQNSKVLDGLANYTVEHFSFEEKNFAKFHYAGAAAHKSEHDAFGK